MSSKYGQQQYGQGYYSSGVTSLVGALSIAPILVGRLTESQPLSGAIVVSMGPAGRITELEFLQNVTLSIVPVIHGDLHDTNNLRGSINIAPVLAGVLFRAGDRLFEGHIDISLLLGGILGTLWRIDSDPLYVSVVLQGDEMYLGGFWKPDVPLDGGWVPIEPADEFWEPIPRSG